jgi:hypothetical protein
MHTQTIVAQVMQCCLPLMHAARWCALRDVVVSSVNGHALGLVALAVGTPRTISVRHRVKCVDRLLGNQHLKAHRCDLYATLARQWLTGLTQLLIVVDWSSLTADMQWHWLRASVVCDGRSITLYEEVHPRKHLGSLAVHTRFIKRLAQLLPKSAHPPIVMTDAGFRNPWFRLIAAQGWQWLGRVRNRDFVRKTEAEDWQPAKLLYQQARTVAADFGAFETVRNSPLKCRLVLVKHSPKGRKHRYASGKVKNNSTARKIASRYREPWLLSCSPSLGHLSAEAVVRLYAQRMRIEEEFRDTKNVVLGAGLALSRSHGQQRLQALLLIGHIAQMVKRLIGEAAKSAQLHLQLTSTCRRERAELSVMMLAKRVIDSPALLRKLKNPWPCRYVLRSQVSAAINRAMAA